jgi:F-box and WD-40 domain protein 1/11
LEHEVWNGSLCANGGYDDDEDVVEETSCFPEPIAKRRAAKSFSNLRHPMHGLRALGRRLSVTIRHKSSRHASHHDAHEDVGAAVHEPLDASGFGEPASAQPWCKGCNPNRRPSLTYETALQTFYAPFASVPAPIPGRGLEPPILPDNIYAGAAARAAAAAQNELARAEREHIKSFDMRVLRDSESGIDIDLRDRSELSKVDLAIVRIDPVTYLPPEIMSLALSYLDPESLMQAELVSRAWSEQASSQHIWRQVFRRAYGHRLPSGVTPKRRQSAGLGKSAPNQDWKKMFLVRRALDHRWKEGKAAAIYLHGHTDSVYCVQFDEYV